MLISTQDLEAFAEDLEDEGEDVQAISTTARPQPSPEKQYSANLEQLSEEVCRIYLPRLLWLIGI